MTPSTDAVIGLDDLLAGGMELQDEDSIQRAMVHLGEIEPYLAGFLDREVVNVAGKLALAGAPSPVCRDATMNLLSIVLTIFAAQRLASNRLWGDAMHGTPLANLINPIPPSDEKS